MVGGENHQRVARTHLDFDKVEQLANQEIGAQRHVVDFRRVRAGAMSDVVVRREAQRQHVRAGVLAELFVRNRLLRELLQHLVAERRGFNRSTVRNINAAHERTKWLVTLLGVDRSPLRSEVLVHRTIVVHLLDPPRQLLHVVVTGDEVLGLVLEPVRRVRHVAGRQDRAAILDRNADDLAALARDLQFVREGADQHAAWRGPGIPRDTANEFRRFVGDTRHHLGALTVIPLVADDAAHRRRRAAHDRRMADRRHGRVVDLMRVREDGALVQQPRKTSMILRAEANQIVVTELVDGDGYHQLRLGGRRVGAHRRRLEDDRQRDEGKNANQLFHGG